MNKILVDLNLIGSNTRPIVIKRKTESKSGKQLNLQLQFDIPLDQSKTNENKE